MSAVIKGCLIKTLMLPEFTMFYSDYLLFSKHKKPNFFKHFPISSDKQKTATKTNKRYNQLHVLVLVYILNNDIKTSSEVVNRTVKGQGH